MRRISLLELGGGTVLAGSAAGKALLERLSTVVDEPKSPTSVFLDFDSIDVATGSFLREGPVAFRDACRSRRSNLYPVFANCSELVIDDLQMLAQLRNDAYLVCELSGDGISNSRIIGTLDHKQQVTLDLVRQFHEVDAVFLKQEISEDVGITAWNNRLAALLAKGLITETTRGRLKRFRLTL